VVVLSTGLCSAPLFVACSSLGCAQQASPPAWTRSAPPVRPGAAVDTGSGHAQDW